MPLWERGGREGAWTDHATPRSCPPIPPQINLGPRPGLASILAVVGSCLHVALPNGVAFSKRVSTLPSSSPISLLRPNDHQQQRRHRTPPPYNHRPLITDAVKKRAQLRSNSHNNRKTPRLLSASAFDNQHLGPHFLCFLHDHRRVRRRIPKRERGRASPPVRVSDILSIALCLSLSDSLQVQLATTRGHPLSMRAGELWKVKFSPQTLPRDTVCCSAGHSSQLVMAWWTRILTSVSAMVQLLSTDKPMILSSYRNVPPHVFCRHGRHQKRITAGSIHPSFDSTPPHRFISLPRSPVGAHAST